MSTPPDYVRPDTQPEAVAERPQWQLDDVVMFTDPQSGERRVAHRRDLFRDEPWQVAIHGFCTMTDAQIEATDYVRLAPVPF